MRTIEQVKKFLSVDIDEFVLRNYNLYNIVELIENYAGENNVLASYKHREENYGIKRIVHLSILCQDGEYNTTLEQTGKDGVYATYMY
jgi:hypothetical protein